jgi:hypothetical protein
MFEHYSGKLDFVASQLQLLLTFIKLKPRLTKLPSTHHRYAYPTLTQHAASFNLAKCQDLSSQSLHLLFLTLKSQASLVLVVAS